MFSSCQRYICKLCFSNIEETDVQNIDVNIQEMLDALLSGIDLPASENPVICKTCHRRSEENYSFKKKCIFIEDSIKPFIVENIKVNFNEIRHQIIKSEDVETEKNVCRLCLQLIENDMVLTDTEKVQFKQFFPEINLDLTICAVVCLECYNKLQEYCIFVTSCKELNRQLSSYSVNNTEQDSNIKLENVHQLSSKMEDDEEHMATLLNHESDIKCEGDLIEIEEPSCSMEYSMEKRNGIKQECFQESLTNIEDDETKFKLLSEELDIKCEDDLPKEKWLPTNIGSINTSFKLQADGIQIENHGLSFKNLEETKSNDSSREGFSEECCNNQQKNTILTANADPSNIQMHKCKECDYKAKYRHALKSHILYHHTDSSQIKMYKCERCDYESRNQSHLKSHVLYRHTDRSKIKMHKCERCDYESRNQSHLKSHILYRHTDQSKIKMHKCDKCDYQSKWSSCFKVHMLSKHPDASKIKLYKCDKCYFESKWFSHLKRHVREIHSCPSEALIYRCGKCDYKAKQKVSLKSHLLHLHTDPSQIETYKCKECDFNTKYKSHLKSHILSRHTDPSEIKMYKCDICDDEFKLHRFLKKHVLEKHTDPSKIKMYKCEPCGKKFKKNHSLKMHVLARHTDLQDITFYQCEQCNKKFKYKDTLKKHIRKMHTGTSKITQCQCSESF